MIYLSKRRDFLEVLKDILEAISRGFAPTRVMMYSNTNYAYIKSTLLHLSEKGFVTKASSEGDVRIRYHLTYRGLQLLKLLSDLQGLSLGTDRGVEDPEYDEKQLEEEARPIVYGLVNKKRRNRSEIYFTILYSAMVLPRSISSIANSCYLNPEQSRRYIEELVDLGMLTEVTNGSGKVKYRTTARGLQYMYLFLKIRELVGELNSNN